MLWSRSIVSACSLLMSASVLNSVLPPIYEEFISSGVDLIEIVIQMNEDRKKLRLSLKERESLGSPLQDGNE